MSRDLIEAIRTIAETKELAEYESVVAKVSDVNTATNTCTCTPIDGNPKLINVMLSVDKSKGFLLIPKNDSLVVVTQYSQTTAFISMVSDVDQIYLCGDDEEGMVTVKSLTDKLNNLENKVNDLIVACSSQVVTLAPSGTFPLASYFASVTPLVPTNKTQIQNTKVKHGSS